MGYRIAVLHQGFIPIYRERFFELLNSSTGNEYVVLHGRPPRGSGHRELPGPFTFPNVKIANRQVILGRNAVIYQPVLRFVLGNEFDALVVGHEIKFVSSMILFATFRALRKPAVLWGHGLHRGSATWAARASSGALARQADAYLAYTETGARGLAAVGVDSQRIFVVRNTLDMRTQHAAKRRFENTPVADLKNALGLGENALALLYIGRLVPHKAVDILIACVRRLHTERATIPVELLIAGDGPERVTLEGQAAGLPNVRFLGEVYDPDDVARLMKVAVAVVLPGTVGLAVNHALAFGRPVITRESPLHSPEIEYIEPGRNGLITGPDPDDFTDALVDFLTNTNLQSQLAAGAAGTAETLQLDHSVDQFDRGVRYAIASRSKSWVDDGDKPETRNSAIEEQERKKRVTLELRGEL